MPTTRSQPPDPDDAIVVDDGPDPDTLAGRFRPAEARNYLFAGLAGLALVFVVLFGRGADLGGLLVVLTGAAGLVFRKAGVPPLVLLLLVYFQLFPSGVPLPDRDPLAVREGVFGVADMVLAAAVLVYIACHYRLYALTARAVPQDTLFPARGEVDPPRRPPGNVRPDEVTRLAVLAAAAVVAGQVAWWGLTAATVDVLAPVPVRFDRPQTVLPWERDGTEVPPPYAAPVTRLLLVVGLAFAGLVAGRLVFGYWRLRRLSPEEGALLLQEAGWDEARREHVRVAAWRAWGRRKQDQGTGTK